MTAVTLNKKFNNTLTNEMEIHIAHLTITSDYTYTPANPTGKTLKVLACYNGTDGATVKCTISAGVITMGNGQTLSNEDTMLMYTFV
jgi:hypothetical protein